MASAPDPQPGLGAAISEMRTSQGLSQTELGKRAELHQTWISHIESGKVNPTYGNVRRIAYALNASLADLADRADKLEPKPKPVRRVRQRRRP